MNIRRKILGISLLLLSVGTVALYAIVSPIIMRGFEKVEDDDICKNTQRATDALQAETNSINSKLSDWAVWDESYNFIQHKNQTFIDTNLSSEIDNPIYDSQLYFDRSGKLVDAYDQKKRPNDLLKQIQSSQLLKNSSVNPKANQTYSEQGFIVSNGTIVLLAAQPIVTSNATGPAVGTLVFTKYISAIDIADLSKQIHLDLSLYDANNAKNPLDVREVAAQTARGSIAIRKPHADTADGYSVLNDVFGKPSVVAKIETDRAIYRQGLSSTNLLRTILICSASLFLLVLYVLLELIVVRRLTHLTTEVSAIRGNPSLRHHLRYKGNDEVAVLANSINNMIERVKDANSQVHKLVGELKVEKAGIEKQVADRTAELHAERDRFLSSITSMPLGFILTDGNGKILMTNPTVTALLKKMGNYQNDTQKSLKDNSSPLHGLLIEAAAASKSRKATQIDIKTADGTFLHASLAPVISDDGELEGVVILIEDVTESKILARSKDEFFSIASHELRTPLTAIRGNTSMIQDFYVEALKDEGLREMIDDIHLSSIRLIEIVNDFLDASSLEQGKMKFKVQDFSLQKVIESVLYELSGVAKDKKLQLTADASIQGLPDARGDQDKVKQILYNLVGNAMKFTDHGNVTISVQLENATRTLKVYIADTGPGITPEGQHLLFHKFQQTNESLHTRDTTRGTGLGLYISLLLAKHMGGSIALEESEPGKGSTFSFSIPLAKQ